MKALVLREAIGPDGFGLDDWPEPAGDGVLIAVRAAGVSFPDLLVSQGRYQETPELPYVAGLDLSGVVLSAPTSADVRPGQRVWAVPWAGGFAERALVDEHRVFPLPDRLSFEDGAAIGSNFLTALFALVRRGRLARGESVLVLGAGGGLGTATIAVARALGARPIGVVGSEEKASAARQAGADAVLVGSGWLAAARELTAGRGVDVVVDIVGGDDTQDALRATAPEGRVLILGFARGPIPSIAANRLLLRNIDVVGVGLGAFERAESDIVSTTAAQLKPVLEAGARPVVGKVVPLAEGASALRLLQTRSAVGKVVLTMAAEPTSH